jgi:lipoyl synthase
MEAVAIGTPEETVSGAVGAPLEVRWLGRVRYNDALALQRALFASQGQYLLLLEHAATYTLGVRASETNFLTPVAQLQANGVDVLKADRGGDVTYHGPGQLTGYPILSLPPKRGTGSGMVDTVAYVTAIEQLVIDTCTDLGLTKVGRVARCTGVWVDPESANPRKIAAIGVKLTRGRSMHGFALNVDADCLEGFNHIVPCGIADKGVTSLAAEGINVSMRTVVDAVVKRAEQLWGPQSGLPVGEGPADGSRSEAELGPVSSTRGANGSSRADANWRVIPDDLAPFSKGAGPGSKAVSRLEKAGVDTSTSVSISERKPEWLRVKANMGPEYMKLKKTVADLNLVTVCEEAGCPNIFDCWNDGTATFMILGERCTRACGFCLVDTRLPLAPDPAEPANVAEAVERMNLQHAVITMVARDDLADGGASAVASTVEAIHRRNPGCRVEVLISDHKGDPASLATVFASRPEVLNHNLETVLRLQRAVRPSASYARSLSVLAQGKAAGLPTKSGIMVGLGETLEEVHQAMRDLRNVGVDILTIGQYLRPTSTHLPTARWWTPEEFDDLRTYGQSLGFAHVEASPLTRSSFHAKAGADAASVPTGPVQVTLSSTRR